MAKKQLAETTHKGAISKAGPHSSLKVVLSSLEYENKARSTRQSESTTTGRLPRRSRASPSRSRPESAADRSIYYRYATTSGQTRATGKSA